MGLATKSTCEIEKRTCFLNWSNIIGQLDFSLHINEVLTQHLAINCVCAMFIKSYWKLQFRVYLTYAKLMQLVQSTNFILTSLCERKKSPRLQEIVPSSKSVRKVPHFKGNRSKTLVAFSLYKKFLTSLILCFTSSESTKVPM